MLDLLQPHQAIILALSGGPDSVYLLHQCLNSNLNLRIILAHVNHQLRGNQSDQDQLFVEQLAKKHRLHLETIRILIPQTGNQENHGRQARYQFFTDLLSKHQADWILTAHHLDDQIETFLLNLSRGSSLQGFTAIKTQDHNRKLYRPLLSTPKSAILQYLSKHNIPYRQDQSNLNLQYARNRLRHQIIPQFQQINPNFLQTIANSHQKLTQNLQFITDYTKTWIRQNVSNDQFSLQKFLRQPEIIQEHLLQFLHQKHNHQSLTDPQKQEILKTLRAQKSNRHKEFGHQFTLSIVKKTSNHERVVVIKPKLN